MSCQSVFSWAANSYYHSLNKCVDHVHASGARNKLADDCRQGGLTRARFYRSTALGALSIQARELVKGRTPRDMSTAQFWTDALQQGGALTVFEQALEADKGFDRIVTQLGGPGLGLARDVYSLTADNALTALKGKDPNLGRDVARFTERYTPGGNLWQSRLLVASAAKPCGFWN